MSTLRTIGMKTSRAQWRSATADAAAMTTSATLRSLTSIGAVVCGSGSGTRRSRSCARSGIGLLWFAYAGLRRHGQSVTALQRLVDGDCRLRPFGGSDNGELHVARRVAHDVQAGDVGLAEMVCLDRAKAIHVASEARGDVALLALAGGEEDGLAVDRPAVGERDRPHQGAVVVDARDGSRTNGDSFLLETAAIAAPDARRAVRAEHDTRGPGSQRQRQARARRPAPDHRDRLVAMLPAIAVRAVVHADAVALVESRNVGEVIADAAGDERHARAHLLAALEGRLEHVVEMHEIGDRGVARLDAIRLQLLASEAQQLERRHAVAREEAMQCGRSRVARLARVTQQQRPPASREHERAAQPGRAATDNDDVEHLPAELQGDGYEVVWMGQVGRVGLVGSERRRF